MPFFIEMSLLHGLVVKEKCSKILLIEAENGGNNELLANFSTFEEYTLTGKNNFCSFIVF